MVCLALALSAATAVARAQKAQDDSPYARPQAAGTLDTRSPDEVRLDSQLAAAWAIDRKASSPQAHAAFEQIRLEAERLGLTRQVAASLRGLATVESSQERNANALTLLQRSLELYRLARDEWGAAQATRQIGLLQGIRGDHAEAMKLLFEARDTFARLGAKEDLALTYYNLVYEMKSDDKASLIPEALAAVRDGGEHWMECAIRHSYGDGLFIQGNYAQAFQELSAALACYETTDEISNKGRVLVSLGRVERAHGQYERALAYYQQAYALHQQVHDEPAALQSLNAIGVAYSYMGRLEEARKCYEEALSRAQALGSERYISFLLGSLGTVYSAMGRYEKALELLQQSLAIEKGTAARMYRLEELGNVLAFLGRLDEALTAMNQALALATETTDARVLILAARASVLQRLNRLDDSDADIRQALQLIEEMRRKTLPQDFMKRGYAQATQETFGIAIDVRSRRGDVRGSLETAEQARARAFLDLLASRRIDSPTSPAGPVAGTAAMMPQNGIPAGLLASAAPASAGAATNVSLSTRGSGGTAPTTPYISAPELNVASPGTAVAPTVDEMIATAARLRSTLLVYWVGRSAINAWVIAPTGQIHEETIPIEPARLSDLVRATTSPLKDDGAALALLGASQRKPWRDLYDLLIKPVRSYLPPTPGSLVTVVPHGPLFQVSFAGLQDEDGRYLIESYRLHYTPSVGVLAYTVDARRRPADASAKALLIGNPARPATDPGDEALAELPWARREVTEIGAILGARHARVITDADATEARIRQEIEQADLLHFATHGVIRQSESMSSFLALAGPEDAAATRKTGGGLADGKLTADEVYGLRLRADLVVLSACGTALGPMSGDGVIGFTRAFLYAGARSVIATEWNVPDQTGYEVMKRFYRFRKRAADTSDALRDAQLEVLDALRNGTLRVNTPGGPVALRENPLFWAGFVLVGKP